MTRQPMAHPFPQPGPLVGLAFRELQLAASGTLEQILPLDDHHELPRPWEPESSTLVWGPVGDWPV